MSASTVAIAGTDSAQTEEGDKPPIQRKRRRSHGSAGEETATSRKESLGGALARALVGTLAFVFRAPVRLFRPVKLSSWNLLEAMAKREGKSLSLRYMRTLIRREKVNRWQSGSHGSLPHSRPGLLSPPVDILSSPAASTPPRQYDHWVLSL